MIRVACPHCGRTYRTRTEGMGKTAVCTKCRQSFKIGVSRPSFKWKETDLGEDSWIGVAPPEEKKEIKHCIMCDAPLEDGVVRCLACGANQVTGVAHRPSAQTPAGKVPIWSMIPARLILVVATVALVGLGVYWAAHWVGQSTAELGEQMADQKLVQQAARLLREGGDEHTLTRRFSGQVTDENLRRFVNMLSVSDPEIRRAAALLIGCGDMTRLQPILDRAGSEAGETQVRPALDAIGSRRLVELSVHEDPQVRQDAARALCLLSNLESKDETIAQLAEPTSVARKTKTLNKLCRPWPQAVGTFVVVIAETESPFTVGIEQIGHQFYMQVRSTEFRSSLAEPRTFHIPIERWCAATGAAVDVTAVRRLLSGSITLVSPVGASWRGTVTLTPQRDLPRTLPGFLPIERPERRETIEVPVRLE